MRRPSSPPKRHASGRSPHSARQPASRPQSPQRNSSAASTKKQAQPQPPKLARANSAIGCEGSVPGHQLCLDRRIQVLAQDLMQRSRVRRRGHERISDSVDQDGCQCLATAYGANPEALMDCDCEIRLHVLHTCLPLEDTQNLCVDFCYTAAALVLMEKTTGTLWLGRLYLGQEDR